LALLIVAFNGATEIHAALVLQLAAGTGIKVDVGFTVLRHGVLPRKVLGGSASELWVTL